MQDMDGNAIKVGDQGGFKDGIEQYGKIVGFKQGYVQIECWDEREHEDVIVSKPSNRVWKEG